MAVLEKKKYFLLLIFLAASVWAASGTAQVFKFERLSIEKGLSQNSVYSILQDSDGFIWLGSQEGLNRFDGYRFSIFSHEESDPNSLGFNTATTLAEDKWGNIWIGTFLGGLNRIDSETLTFSRYRNLPGHHNSLGHDLIRCLVIDSAGRLWIATDGGGLNLMVPNGAPSHHSQVAWDPAKVRFTRFCHDIHNPVSISSNYLKTLYLDRQDNLWIGTSGGGLDKMIWPDEGSKKEWLPWNSPDQMPEIHFKHYSHDPANPKSISDDYVLSIFEDRKGMLWVGTGKGGLNRFDRQTETFTCFSHDPSDRDSLCYDRVNALWEDHSGYLWIGTGGGGVDILPPGRDNKKNSLAFIHCQKNLDDPYSISDNMVLTIYEDPQGIVWVGTEGGGVNTFNRKKYKFDHYVTNRGNPDSLSDPMVRCIFEDGTGNLWVGTNNGLNRMDRESGRFTHFFHDPGDSQSISNNVIRAIYQDRSGILWIGTESGDLNQLLDVPGVDQLRFKHYRVQGRGATRLNDEAVIAIFEDSEGVLWIGTHGKGVSRFFPKTGRFIHHRAEVDQPGSLSYGVVRFIFEDSRGTLWLGTDGGGMNRFNRDRETFSVYLHRPEEPLSLSCNYLLCAYESPSLRGILWIGTHGGGLNRMDLETGHCKYFVQKHGLPNDVVYGILEATVPGEETGTGKMGKLWLSTNKGLCEFDPETGATRNYSRSDGLQSDEFNGNAYFKSKSGEMYFGGLNGFNGFHPLLLASNPYVPPVVLTDFKLFHQSVPLVAKVGRDSGSLALERPIYRLPEIRLSHDQNFFSFEFSSLDYTAPEKNRYLYLLEGVDKNWVSCHAQYRVANYTGMAPGTYTFRVKASNNDGVWNEQGASIRVIISPPFWRTYFFQVIIVLVGLGIIVLFIRGRVNRVQRKASEEQARLKREMEKRELEKELKLKADWTSMLVHELRSPLTAILGYSELMKTDHKDPGVERTAEMIAESTDRMLVIINDMLDISKFEAGKMKIYKTEGNLETLVHDVVKLMTPLSASKQLNVVVEVKELENIHLDREKVRQVINNLFSNALKFSPRGGNIIITCGQVEMAGEWFQEFSIGDEGPGVPVESRPFLFDKYAQVHQDIKIKGTGLGLAVSRLIIDAHGGQIGYHSSNEKGSVFYFRLPFARVS